jgi:hypothetical protein
VVEVLIDDEAMRIEQGDHLLVSPPCVYDLRPRRITAVGVQGRQQYRPVQAIQLVLWALELARAVWRMPCYRRAALAPCMGHALPMHLFDYLQDYTSKSG